MKSQCEKKTEESGDKLHVSDSHRSNSFRDDSLRDETVESSEDEYKASSSEYENSSEYSEDEQNASRIARKTTTKLQKKTQEKDIEIF